MNERGRNEADISRYTDVEYSPEGYKTVYRWGDFLEIAGGHVYNAMDTIDLVSAGGEYEGFNPRYAYTCEFVGCSTLIDGIALFRPVSRDGEDLTQIAFLRSDIDDDTGAYTERFEAGSFDIAAASDIQCSDLGIDLLDYFRGRSFEGLSGVKRGLNGREAVGAVEVATGCDLDLFEDFHILLDNIYDSPDVGPCSLPRFAQRAYGSAQESYRFGETKFDIYQVAAFPDLPYIAKISTGEGACEDAGPRFASVGEAKEWCYQYSLRELAGAEKKPDPAEAAAAAKRAAGSTGGDGAGDAGAIKL